MRFCILESPDGGETAVNVDAVVAVRADGGRSVIVHQGGEIPVKGVWGEVVLKLLAIAGQTAASEPAPGVPKPASRATRPRS